MLLDEWMKFYYQNKKKLEALLMIIIGIIVFLLFWFLPSATSTWDKIMHGMGYICAILSFVFGLLFLFRLLPNNVSQSYDVAEKMINNKKKRKKDTSVVKIASQKTFTLAVPVTGIVILGYILGEYSWQHVGYALLFIVAYYCYHIISAKKNS